MHLVPVCPCERDACMGHVRTPMRGGAPGPPGVLPPQGPLKRLSRPEFGVSLASSAMIPALQLWALWACDGVGQESAREWDCDAQALCRADVAPKVPHSCAEVRRVPGPRRPGPRRPGLTQHRAAVTLQPLLPIRRHAPTMRAAALAHLASAVCALGTWRPQDMGAGRS